MALNRRAFLIAMPACAGLIGCGTGDRPVIHSAGYRELFNSNLPGASDTVLVCMPETSQTREVWTGLSDELGKHYRLIAINTESSDASAAIAEGIRRHQPSGLVLMNNPTVAAYRALQRSSARKAFPPAVIVM